MTEPDHRVALPREPGRYDRIRLVFLDIEAVSLEAGSWPIELGFARVLPNAGISIDSDRFRPHSTWPEELWSPESAEVHGVPRIKLREAPDAQEVAEFYFPLLRGKTLVSDAPAFDERWLHMLTSLVDPVVRLRIEDFDAVLVASCDAAGVRRAYEELETLPTPHRAGDAAARLAHAWLAGVSE